MTIFTLFLIAFSLAMDAFAIAVANGVAHRGAKSQALYPALAFGLAQGIMPVLGYVLGSGFSGLIHSVDHWLAFILLLLIGGKMLLEGLREWRCGGYPELRPLTGKTLFLQAVATSIDALAVGVGFAALEVNIVGAALIITAVTFICCLIGGVIGQKWGCLLKKGATIFGGLILILIGCKILLEHLGLI